MILNFRDKWVTQMEHAQIEDNGKKANISYECDMDQFRIFSYIMDRITLQMHIKHTAQYTMPRKINKEKRRAKTVNDVNVENKYTAKHPHTKNKEQKGSEQTNKIGRRVPQKQVVTFL